MLCLLPFMINIKPILIAIVLCFSATLFAQPNYQGLIVAHVIEPNGHVYRGYDGFMSSGKFKDKQMIYFEQERGQKVALSGGKMIVDSSSAQKYHMILEILQREGDKYQAEISFYHNNMEYQEDKQDYVLVSKEIKKAVVNGTLNTENNYSFIDDEKPNLKVSINIDKIFSKEEILKKLQRKIK